MERKIGIAIVILGLAAFSPAPINKAHGPRTFVPEMSQEQVAKQQALNGITPVVGQVEMKLDEFGRTKMVKSTVSSSHEGEDSIARGTSSADKVASSITQASNRVESEENPAKYAWFYGLLIACLGFLSWKLFQYKIEKSTPVPEFSKKFLQDFENGKL